ncbi:MAG TPA: YebC/PmpR family DNA-binding transcriptional regulator [Deltaproteobacteria bacterium]|nr:MAG: transcriptional regulator [Deltaproteobacteria bacterium GWA2_55_82]OGQ63297.1 MAG: transcriptional regulator [Deltaproteobacteria bacterium RIFCSPLOWO2_02_FULL_55_12]OIJ73133.1 MAG: transcriptional regulator [Deltaproteobacteria bacterium GWC2_55_46]HBG47903.1 YebC/PmpR family DNA-binding transcriptional regulator [Deltaproteobacteria bacterium]HCY11834.1 YebC/PmpR family DNA-binding transcriptional regulator [Deltaproteobacteria bacterium]
MSGHSKWANIKHKKAKSDAKKGKVFTKLVKEIMVAAKSGSDPSGNPRLRLAIEKAKAENLPADNIDRAIKKGAGELGNVIYEEGTYEGYGPSGVAVLVNFMTDNRNRTASEVRHAFSSLGGSLGQSGSVAYMFEKKGVFTFDMGSITEESLMEAALEAGAEDVVTNQEDKVFEVYTDPTEYARVKASFDQAGVKYSNSDLAMIPKTTVKVEGKAAQQVLNLLEELEDLDDVQSVFANFDISPEEMAKLA